MFASLAMGDLGFSGPFSTKTIEKVHIKDIIRALLTKPATYENVWRIIIGIRHETRGSDWIMNNEYGWKQFRIEEKQAEEPMINPEPLRLMTEALGESSVMARADNQLVPQQNSPRKGRRNPTSSKPIEQRISRSVRERTLLLLPPPRLKLPPLLNLPPPSPTIDLLQVLPPSVLQVHLTPLPIRLLNCRTMLTCSVTGKKGIPGPRGNRGIDYGGQQISIDAPMYMAVLKLRPRSELVNLQVL